MPYDNELQNLMSQAKVLYARRDPGTYRAYYDIYTKYPNNPYVCESLGHCLLNGIGIPADRAAAREFFSYAAQNGDPNAAQWVQICDNGGVPVMPGNSYSVPAAQPVYQNAPVQAARTGGGNIAAMIIALILAVLNMSTPFVKAIQDAGGFVAVSMYQVTHLAGNIFIFSGVSGIRLLYYMFEQGGTSAVIACTYIIAVLMFFAAVIEIIIAIAMLGSNNAKHFWRCIRVTAAAMLLIDVIAFAWVMMVNVGFDKMVLSFYPLYYVEVAVSFTIIVICSICGRK